MDNLRLLPFRTFILKLHERCNLRCDYCYVFQLNGESWRSRPSAMPRSVIDDLAVRIGEHAAEHGMPSVDIVFHGGEPMLAGPETIAYAVRAIRTALGRHTEANFSIQTNGTLLNDRSLQLFEDLGMKVGLSLDGDEQMHDRHRPFPGGRSSYSKVATAARLLSGHPRLFAGILSVIDLRNDPIRMYEELASFDPPVIDFLLPHGNWSMPPRGRPAVQDTAPYGDWLVSVFDHWYRAAGAPAVRLFEEIICVLLGGSSRTEEIGLSPVTVVVVESNGDMALSDVLMPPAEATGLNVARDSFTAALRAPQAAAGQERSIALAAQCRACPVGAVCGGGLHAHRYRDENGFDNPSVYCADLYRLITHIGNQVRADLSRTGNGS